MRENRKKKKIDTYSFFYRSLKFFSPKPYIITRFIFMTCPHQSMLGTIALLSCNCLPLREIYATACWIREGRLRRPPFAYPTRPIGKKKLRLASTASTKTKHDQKPRLLICIFISNDIGNSHLRGKGKLTRVVPSTKKLYRMVLFIYYRAQNVTRIYMHISEVW